MRKLIDMATIKILNNGTYSVNGKVIIEAEKAKCLTPEELKSFDNLLQAEKRLKEITNRQAESGRVSAKCAIQNVSGFKIDRINKMKELFEKELVRFDRKAANETEKLIIGYDFGSGKDESRKHIFYYR